jgi:hypothetical protein
MSIVGRLVGSLGLVAAFAVVAPPSAAIAAAPSEPLEDAKCHSCGADSTGACAPQDGKTRMECFGTRGACERKGCKVTSSGASCSNASNVGQC